MVNGWGLGPILERTTELRAIRTALDSARAGTGSLVVVEAPAGMGKSRLLEEARLLAEEQGLSTYAARGGLLEQDQAYGAVRLLLQRAVVDLPEHDRTRLFSGAASLAASALASDVAPTSDDLGHGAGVDHGLYSVLARLAEEAPLLIAVDDVQWFDTPSVRFLVYLARRVPDLPVVLLVATRPVDVAAGSRLIHQLMLEPGAEELRPAPLSTEAVATLLSDRMGQAVDIEFADACRVAVAGNPFLLTQLVEALVSDGVSPTRGSRARLEGVRPPTVARSILLRIARMPTTAAALVRAAAVLGAGTSLETVAAVAGVEPELAGSAWDQLAAEQILTRTLPIEFVHPIVREAVSGELGPAEAMRLHGRAAQILTAGGASLEAVAPHHLLGPAEGRAETVEILHRAATAARDRGAPDLAVRYLRRALNEPPAQSASRARILVDLGVSGLIAAEPPKEVQAYLREALGLLSEPRSRIEPWLVLSKAQALHESVPGAVAILDEALTDLAGLEPSLLAPLEHELCGQGLMHPDTHADAMARLGPPPDSGSTAARRLALCVHASVQGFAGAPVARTEALALSALADGRLDQDLGPESTTRHQLAYVLATIERSDLALELLDATLAASTTRGSAFGVAGALGTRSITRFMTGRLAEAEADGLQALAVPGIPMTVVPAISAFTSLAMVERGALVEADDMLAASGCGPDLPEILSMHYAFLARGRLRAAQGRPQEALEDLAEFARRAERVGLRTPVASWRADAALLSARVGKRSDALRLSSEYTASADGHGTPRVMGIARRVSGLLTGGAEGLDLLREAVELHTQSPARLELAHSQAELGAAVRRANQRREALDILGDAARLAEECGALALLTRVAHEVTAAGGSGRSLITSGSGRLTPSELRVARLAVLGRTNREIGEELYVSAKTVENHLGRAYVKLGIASRAALAGSLGPLDPQA